MRRKKILKIVFYVVNTLVGLLFLFPLLFMFLSAFNPARTLPTQIGSFGDFLPEYLTASNLVSVFTRIPMLKYFGNTLLYAFGTVLGVLVVNSMAGYALAKINFKGNRLIYNFIVIMLIIPFEGITLTLYLVVKTLGILDTPFAVILPSLFSCFYIFMFRQFFLGVPTALIEAAEIDGSGAFSTYFRIVVPTAVPVFITVFILEFIGKWGDYYWPMLTLTSETWFNVQIAIKEFSTASPYHWGTVMASLAVVTVPVLVVFLCLQKYYIEGIATQGIKDM
ncbi:MAG: carbohydrate ABC transporter permease [Candidatus Gallimonas sp.]